MPEIVKMIEATFIGKMGRHTKKGKYFTSSWWIDVRMNSVLQASCFDKEVNILIDVLKQVTNIIL